MALSLEYFRRFYDSARQNAVRNQWESPKFSRRTFLSSSTSLVIATAPLIRALGSQIELRKSGDRISLLLDGEERWAIAPSLFAGSPQVEVVKAHRNHFVIELRGARYPGTPLSADTRLEIVRSIVGWDVNLRFLGGIAQIQTGLLEWLNGNSAAVDIVGPGLVSKVAGRGALRLIAPSAVSFGSDWTLLFSRRAAVHFSGLGVDIKGEDLRVELRPPETEGGLGVLESPSSALYVTRGRQPWGLLNEELAKHRNLWSEGEPFDSLALELAELKGKPLAAAVFRSESNAGRIGIHLAESLRDSAGNPIRSGLRNPIYALSFSGEEQESLLLANLERDLEVHGSGFSAILTNPVEGAAFQVAGRNGTITHESATGAVYSITAPELQGAIATFKVPHGARMPLFWDTIPYVIPDAADAVVTGAKDFFCLFGLCERSRLCLDKVTVSILRPQDFLALDFRFRDLSLATVNGRPFLVRAQPHDVPLESGSDKTSTCSSNSSQPCLIVDFPAQSTAEECFLEVQPKPPDSCGDVPSEIPHHPVRTILSGTSRLVFAIPDDLLTGKGMQFNLENLLDWKRLIPVLPDNAQPPVQLSKDENEKCLPSRPGAPKALDPDVTQIEFPYRLLIAPHCASRWLHAGTLAKVEESSRSELWHTSLGVSKTTKNKQEIIDINDARLRTIRAVWARDYEAGMNDKEDPCNPSTSAVAFRMAMNPIDRSQIVRLSSDYTIQTLDAKGKAVPYTPRAVAMKHLALSSLGAWFDGIGQWEIPQEPGGRETFNVEGWTHRASQSRDHFVKVVYRAFLAPFGHRVAVIKETQRFFYCGDEPVDTSDATRNVCYLRQKFYIVVREPVKVYPAPGQPYEGRHLPFRKVEIRTLTTPALDDPCDKHGGGYIPGFGLKAFWPFVHGQPFFFEVAGYDWADPAEACVFRMPMVCIDNITAAKQTDLRTIEADYLTHNDRRQAQFAGQQVHFASSQKSGDTRLQCDSMFFDFEIPPDQPTACPDDWCGFDEKFARYSVQPFFYPKLEKADVDIPAVQHVSQDTSKSSVLYPLYYLQHGFSAARDASGPHNPGEVFLEKVQNSATSLLKFQGPKGGGFVVPNISISGVSRQLGAVSGKAEDVAKNAFNSNNFFAAIQGIDDALNPKLFGFLPLGDVIAPLRDIRAELAKVPQLLLEQLHDVSEWLKKALNDEVFKRFQDMLSTVQKSLDAVQQKIGSEIATAMGGPPDVKLKAIAEAIQSQITAKMSPVRRDFSLPPLQPNLASTNSSVPTNITLKPLCDIHKDIQKVLGTLQQQAKLITQQDRDEIDKTFTLFADREWNAFQNKLNVVKGVIASLHSTLPIAALAEAVNKLVKDLGQISDPTKWPDLIVSLPDKFKSVLTEAGRLRTSLQRTAASLNQEVGPDTLKKLLSQSVSDAKALVSGEIQELHDSLRPLLTEIATKLDQYKTSAIYTPYNEAIAAFTQAKTDILALQQDLDNLAQAAIDQAIAEFDKQITALFNAAIDAAFNAIPPVFWTALFAISDFEAQLSALLEQIARPVEITVRYDLAPALRDAPASSPIFLAHGAGDKEAKFVIHVQIRKRLDPLQPSKILGERPEFHLDAKLTSFSIKLLPSVPFFTLQFTSATITVDGSQHPEVAVKLDPDNPIVFGGALQFIHGFIDAVKNFGGDEKNGPFIRIYPWGVRAGYSFTSPDITAGGFNVHGLALSASVELSFENKPLRVRFHFAERSHPFILSAGIYGGGGYFLIALGPDGVEQLEIALEFGAFASIDIALASGQVHILGGIYYSSDGHDCRLAGFVDAGGCLKVIGMIDVNLDFYLGLSYTSNGTVEGECTVTVEIGFAFFSITVHLTAHRTFSQGGGSSARLRHANASPAVERLMAAPSVSATDVVPSKDCKPLSRLRDETNWKNNYYSKFSEVSGR